jgi:hypothetical protein
MGRDGDHSIHPVDSLMQVLPRQRRAAAQAAWLPSGNRRRNRVF